MKIAVANNAHVGRQIVLFAWMFFCLAALGATAQKITVVTEEYPPYNYTENEKVTGAGTEIVRLMLERAGIEYSLTSYPWARAYKMAQQSPNVMIYSIGRNGSRENAFKWVGIIAPYDVYLYKLKERTDVKVETLDDARQYIVGVVNDDVRAQFLQNEGFAESREGPGLQITVKDENNLHKLVAGRIDLFPIDELACAHLAKRCEVDFAALEKTCRIDQLSSGLYVAMSMSTPDELVERCRAAMEDIKKDGLFQSTLDQYLR